MRKRKRLKVKQANVLSISIPNNLDYQKLADAIVDAQMRAKEIEKCELEKETQKKQDEWKKILGYKEYPVSKFKFVNGFYNFINHIKVLLRIIFFKKEHAKFGVATALILNLSIKVVLSVIEKVMYIIAGILTVVSFYSFGEEIFTFNCGCFFLAIVLFVVARAIRIAKFEIDNIHDRNYLIGLSSAVSAFAAMILAIASLMVSLF